MGTESLENFLSGALMMAQFLAGLFFLRFWKKTNDRFFAMFALAFFMLGSERIVLLALNTTREEHTYVYVIRLLAFLLIIFAILGKNRPSKPPA